MTYTDIIYDKKDNIATITFNREEVRNAIRYQTWIDIKAAIGDAKVDDKIRAVIITGNGKAFSAGADLAEMGKLVSDDVNYLNIRQGVVEIQEITREMVSLKKPIISALNGYAVGAGAEIAIASDIRIASDLTTFEFAEAKVGLFETNGVTWLLPRLVGLGRAMELMLTGRRIDAEEAKAIGLVTSVVKPEALMQNAIETASILADNAPVSIGLVKTCLMRSGEIGFDDSLVYETDALMACAMTEDVKEGALAFLEKRKPKFQGK